MSHFYRAASKRVAEKLVKLVTIFKLVLLEPGLSRLLADIGRMQKISSSLKRVVYGGTSGLLALSFLVLTPTASSAADMDMSSDTGGQVQQVSNLLPPYNNLPPLAKLKKSSELSDPKDFYSRLVTEAEELAAEEAARKAAEEEAARKAAEEAAAKEAADRKAKEEAAAKAAADKKAAEAAAREVSNRAITSASRTESRGTPGMRCEASSGDASLNPWVSKVRTRINEQFGVSDIGGTRPGDPQDHGKGLALDVMVPVGSDLGDAVAAWAVENHEALAIKYVIWEQRIWNPSASKSWRVMEDRGSITQNHYDHVHLSFTGSSGTCP